MHILTTESGAVMRVPRVNPYRPGGPRDREEACKQLLPAYRAACEAVDYWKVQEMHSVDKKAHSRNFLTRLFWQIRYLSAVGNGAEAERCRDGLLDPHWGVADREMQGKISSEAFRIGIERENKRRPEP